MEIGRKTLHGQRWALLKGKQIYLAVAGSADNQSVRMRIGRSDGESALEITALRGRQLSNVRLAV